MTAGQPEEKTGEASMAGRTALVTGGASGLGRALSLELAAAGAQVAVADVNESGARETAELIGQAGGRADAVRLDVTDRAAVDAAIGELGERHGAAFDCLVLNAGTDRGADLRDVDDEQWHRVFDVNVHGPMYLGRAFVRHLDKHAQDGQVGDIVSVVSISALTVGAGAAAYNSSKAAMHKLAEIMQTEAREQSWPARVSIFDPAAMDTPMMEQWGIPKERMMNPRAVARVVRTAVTLPTDMVMQSVVLTPRTEFFPR